MTDDMAAPLERPAFLHTGDNYPGPPLDEAPEELPSGEWVAIEAHEHAWQPDPTVAGVDRCSICGTLQFGHIE